MPESLINSVEALFDNLESMTEIGMTKLEGAVAARVDGSLPVEPDTHLVAWPVKDGTVLTLTVVAESAGPVGFVRAEGSVTYVGREPWERFDDEAMRIFVERTGVPALIPYLRATLQDQASRLSLPLPGLGLWKTDFAQEYRVSPSSPDESHGLDISRNS